jgi:hypothetical protein
MKTTSRRFLLTMATAVALTFTSAPASPLSDLVKEHGMEWLIAKWGDKDTKGQVVELKMEWRLDKHALSFALKSPERSAEALAALKPGTEKIVQMGVDNQGNAAKGEWGVYDGSPILRVDYETPEGDEGRVGLLVIKSSETEVVLKVYKLDSDGDPDGDQKITMPLVKLDK